MFDSKKINYSAVWHLQSQTHDCNRQDLVAYKYIVYGKINSNYSYELRHNSVDGYTCIIPSFQSNLTKLSPNWQKAIAVQYIVSVRDSISE